MPLALIGEVPLMDTLVTVPPPNPLTASEKVFAEISFGVVSVPVEISAVETA